MNKVGALLLFTMLFNFIHSFKIRNPDIHKVTRKRSSVKSSANDFNADLNIVHKFRGFFDKDSYNDVINDILNKKISKIFVDTNYKQLVSIDNLPASYNVDLPQEDIIYNHYHLVDINPIVLPNLIEKTSDLHIPVYFVNFTPEIFLNVQNVLNEIFVIGSYAFPVLFLLSFISSFRNMNTFSNPNPSQRNQRNMNNNNPFSLMGNNNKKPTEFIKPNVTLESWAGSPEVIEECREVISYIENKERYKKIGADMPKGILLDGPPGTGKTLLAKAIAGETNSTFISISGSEFVELFVGMGAARVRELFDNARANTPCIIFIDEIDAVGRQRGAGINMANDEREQTLNQLLYEMDGFNNNDDVVVMAATNRKDVLDQALLRPGRFDRLIRVPLPDKESREKILDYYLKNKNLDNAFDISAIAELTDGFSGAQLKNLINEAAIISARNNYNAIQEKFIFDAFEKLIVGLIKANATVAPATRLRVALHESGHALLALKFNDYFEFKKASIQPTYNGAGGYTIFTEKPEIKEGGLYTKDLLKKRLIVAMGGKAAEAIYYGNEYVSMGAIQDLKQANGLAKRMIGNFGMGNRLEVFYNEDVGDDGNPFLGRSLALGDKYSEHTRVIMDRETLDLVKEAYEKAKEILKQDKEKLIEFSELLQNSTVVYNRDLQGFTM
jgi:cell division protease FtsH